MSNEIRPATSPSDHAFLNDQEINASGRSLVAMRIGGAIVYVERVSETIPIENDDGIRPVSPQPADAFKLAIGGIRDCVRVIAEEVETLGDYLPRRLEVEFGIDLHVQGKAAIIPIFATGEAGMKTALKVKAIWEGGGRDRPPASPAHT